MHMLIMRTDFMVDQTSRSLKLVEFNTIAAGLGSLSQKVFELQKYVLAKYGEQIALKGGDS